MEMVGRLSKSNAVEQVLQVEREWLLAHLNCDVAELDRLMADEYTQVNDEGKVVRKAEVIASFESGARHWDEARSDELQVRVYGETAVVIGRWQAKTPK